MKSLHETIFSPCRTYRYTLWREWCFGNGYAMFIGLNPSTADETKDDPTIRRCVDYAQRWGYSALCMTNLFAFRATHPWEFMEYAGDPIGPDNNKWLSECSFEAGIIVAAWGNHGKIMGRDEAVKKLISPLHYLKLSKSGQPWHPLYLKKDIYPIQWKCEQRIVKA